jgi:hypothetical protein
LQYLIIDRFRYNSYFKITWHPLITKANYYYSKVKLHLSRGASTLAADLRSPQTHPPERPGLRRASTLAPNKHLAPHPAHETAIASVPNTIKGSDAVNGRYPEQDLVQIFVQPVLF